MSKLILTGACAVAVLGLAACDYDKDEYNNAAGYNAEETNYTTGNADDYGNMANDMNMADNDMINGADTNTVDSAGNSATTNGY